jgi:hypothetical protein
MSSFSKYTEDVSGDVRNTAILLEEAEMALSEGEINLDEYTTLAEDIFDICFAGGVLDETIRTQYDALRTITFNIIRG